MLQHRHKPFNYIFNVPGVHSPAVQGLHRAVCWPILPPTPKASLAQKLVIQGGKGRQLITTAGAAAAAGGDKTCLLCINFLSLSQTVPVHAHTPAAPAGVVALLVHNRATADKMMCYISTTALANNKQLHTSPHAHTHFSFSSLDSASQCSQMASRFSGA